ncbi:MAG: ferrous iron transport protein A [Methanobrevibacter sp.]|jgi:ferrous iron transport protein A|nr:ferrous iron transport protein A [Candidatus Methanovirga australis]
MTNEKDFRTIKTLNELKVGEEGIILSYNDKKYYNDKAPKLKNNENQYNQLKRHLLGMGFVKGAKIKLEKIAPLGDPIKIKIKGYSISLRKSEAKNIEVELN